MQGPNAWSGMDGTMNTIVISGSQGSPDLHC